MKAKSVVAKFMRMKAGRLAEITKAFDEELFIDQTKALKPSEKRKWESIRRKPGRPRRGAGVKVVSVSVEKTLLQQSDALAKRLGISRALLIESGLRAVLRRADDRRVARGA